MKTLKQIKSGATLEQPIYFSKPYVITNNEDMVLWAGDLDEMMSLDSYYDDCIAKTRQYDLHLGDNRRINILNWKYDAPLNPFFLGAQPARNGEDY
jgi:hypothetical protein